MYLRVVPRSPTRPPSGAHSAPPISASYFPIPYLVHRPVVHDLCASISAPHSCRCPLRRPAPPPRPPSPPPRPAPPVSTHSPASPSNHFPVASSCASFHPSMSSLCPPFRPYASSWQGPSPAPATTAVCSTRRHHHQPFLRLPPPPSTSAAPFLFQTCPRLPPFLVLSRLMCLFVPRLRSPPPDRPLRPPPTSPYLRASHPRLPPRRIPLDLKRDPPRRLPLVTPVCRAPCRRPPPEHPRNGRFRPCPAVFPVASPIPAGAPPDRCPSLTPQVSYVYVRVRLARFTA